MAVWFCGLRGAGDPLPFRGMRFCIHSLRARFGLLVVSKVSSRPKLAELGASPPFVDCAIVGLIAGYTLLAFFWNGSGTTAEDTPVTIRGGAEEFKTGSYERIFTTGGPENGNGGYTNDYNTSASVGAEILKKFGVPDDLLQMVPSRVIGRERTYSSAVALRNWFRGHNMFVHSINVVTGGRPRAADASSLSESVRKERDGGHHRSLEPGL